MGSLDGKVALITGAGGMKGIGRATALKLATQGADIVLSDVQRKPENLPPQEVQARWRSIDSVAEEVEALGRRSLKIWCDLTRTEQIEAMVRQAADHFGHIDILVNNARAIIGRDRVPITELSEEVWRHFLEINTTAVFLVTKFVGQVMVRQGRGGRIINIASDASKRAKPMTAAYTSSKFAVLGLTQAAALDLAPHRITVNAVCPGTVNTDRLNYWEQAQARAQDVAPEAFRAQVIANSAKATPLGRVAESEDVANLVAFLASDEANFITAQAYNVNGGVLSH
jgi:3-oxoacyl-[acyl-carrier protein] reductase/meso-butanediol dehydrogenase/(S,S)-butanediol dehydrogenase/diacetyl reductase